jgi:hypothetical protein
VFCFVCPFRPYSETLPPILSRIPALGFWGKPRWGG